MFVAEVRSYREIASEVGVRVPACRSALVDESGTRLELEDLSAWEPGADLAAAAVQSLPSLADGPVGSPEAAGWLDRLRPINL
jgi:hypothetical protein